MPAGQFSNIFPIQSHAQKTSRPPIPRTGDQVNVLITSGVSTANYELCWTPVLADPIYPWTLLSIGTLGQTNFGVLTDSTELAFME